MAELSAGRNDRSSFPADLAHEYRWTGPPRLKRLTVPVGNGIELSVLMWNEDGPSTPVLLVHGLASNARLWHGVASLLSKDGHPVAAVDQRGHGMSSKPDQGYDFDTLISDLVSVIDYLSWDRPPVLAGQSMGGNVVLQLAATHPSVVSGVVLVDGGTIELSSRFAEWSAAAAALAPPALVGMRADDFEQLIRKGHPDWPEEGIAGTLANTEVLPDGTIRPWLSREHHMQILRAMWDQHPSSLYPQVTAPVLLVMAAGDATKSTEVEGAAASFPRSTVRWVAGDHDLHAQHPKLVADAIEELA